MPITEPPSWNAWFSAPLLRARRTAPSGRSNVSPCQWNTSRNGGKRNVAGCSAPASPSPSPPASAATPWIGSQPISLTVLGYTAAPQALAISCAPRHTPSTGRCSSIAARMNRFSAASQGYCSLVVHAHRAAHRHHEVHLGGRRQFVGVVEPRRGHLVPGALQPGFDAPETFERNVLQIVCAHGSPQSLAYCSRKPALVVAAARFRRYRLYRLRCARSPMEASAASRSPSGRTTSSSRNTAGWAVGGSGVWY